MLRGDAGSPKDDHVRADPVLQMAPPHMCLINSSKRTGRAHTTCVNFGQKGDKVNLFLHTDLVLFLLSLLLQSVKAIIATAWPEFPRPGNIKRWKEVGKPMLPIMRGALTGL